jgi:methylmalonyl-CoA epimerase
MFTRLINVALAVNDIDEAITRFEKAFGWTLDGEVNNQPGLGIKTAMLKAADTTIELIAPLPGEQVLRRFLDTRGEGVYRLAFADDKLDQTLSHFDQNEVRYVDLSGPAGRENGNRIVFTNPKSAHGLMLELVEGAEQPA